MNESARSVCITVVALVLDRPDRSGKLIAKDLAGGWAYLISDDQGDSRFRGQGTCPGGMESGLRYALLSAIGHVPGSRALTVCVDTPEAHRCTVRLAKGDAQIVAAIDGRPVSVVTRPELRAMFHVRSAAERAASVALRAREQHERAPVDLPQAATAAAAPDLPAPASPHPGHWRDRWGVAHRGSERDRGSERAGSSDAGVSGSAAVSGNQEATRGRLVARWLEAFDRSVKNVKTELDQLKR